VLEGDTFEDGAAEEGAGDREVFQPLVFQECAEELKPSIWSSWLGMWSGMKGCPCLATGTS
jgi:hypothetical protein